MLSKCMFEQVFYSFPLNPSLVPSYDDPTASHALMQRRQKRNIPIPEQIDSAMSHSDVEVPTTEVS